MEANVGKRSEVVPHLKWDENRAYCSACGSWKAHSAFYKRHRPTGPPVWPRCKRCRKGEDVRPNHKSKQRQASEGIDVCHNGRECISYEVLGNQPARLSKSNPHRVCNACKRREINLDMEAAQQKERERMERYR